MNIKMTHFGIRSSEDTDAQIENDLRALEDRVTIEAAHVRLERRHENAPPYRVSVHLVTPGPDLRVEGADHTLDAARRKAVNALKRRLAVKSAQRRSRSRSNEHLTSLGRRGRLTQGRASA